MWSRATVAICLAWAQLGWLCLLTVLLTYPPPFYPPTPLYAGLVTLQAVLNVSQNQPVQPVTIHASVLIAIVLLYF